MQLVEFWVLSTAGTLVCPLPDVDSWTISPVANDAGAAELVYPVTGLNWATLHQCVNQDRRVHLQVRIDGVIHPELQITLFEGNGDDINDGATWSYRGWLPLGRLKNAVVKPKGGMPTQGGDSTIEQDAHYYSSTAGTVMGTCVAEAKLRGALTNVTTTSFSGTHDSNGATWSKIITLKLTPGIDLLKVLAGLVEAGMCDAKMVGTDLRLYEQGTVGVDRTLTSPPLVFRRGQSLTDSPRKHTTAALASAALVAGADGEYVWVSDASAQTRLGERIETSVSQGSIRDPGTLTAYAQHYLEGVVTGRMQKTHGGTVGDGPVPVEDFDTGDWSWSALGSGLEKLRVAQWTLSGASDGTLSWSAVLNDLIAERDAALATRLRGIEGGTTITGTSTARPVIDIPDTVAPAAPQGVVVESLAQPSPEAVPRAAVVTQWAPVTLNADATPIEDLDVYLVQWRYLSPALTNNWVQLAPVDTEYADWSAVIAGEGIEVRVSAVDHTGNQSLWSSPSAFHTTETDATAPPTPSTPTAVEFLGTITTGWDGLGALGEVMPEDTVGAQIHRSTVSGFTPTPVTFQEVLYGAGARNYTDLPIGTTQYFRLVAFDRTGNFSAPSAQSSAIPQLVQNGDIAALNVGKILTGTLTAVVTNAGIVRSGATGLRYELDSAGLRFYDNTGNVVINLNVASASAVLTGTVQTGRSGRRVVLSGVDSDIKFFPQTGETRYGRIFSYIPGNFPNDVAVEIRSIDSDSTDYTARHWMLPDSQSISVVPQGYGGDLISKAYVKVGIDGVHAGYHNIIGSPPYTAANETVRAQLVIAENGVSADCRDGNDRDGGFLQLNRGVNNAVFLGLDTLTAYNYIHVAQLEIQFYIQNSRKMEISANGVFATQYHGYGPSFRATLKSDAGNEIFFYWSGGSLHIGTGASFVKTFVIDHPQKPDRYLVHSTTESPHAGVEYWGEATVEDGEVEIKLPEYFEALTRQEGRNVQVTVLAEDDPADRRRLQRKTPRKKWSPKVTPDAPLSELPPVPPGLPSHVQATYPRNGRFTIYALGPVDTFRVMWLVKAIRADVPQFDVEPIKAAGSVLGDGPYTYYVPHGGDTHDTTRSSG